MNSPAHAPARAHNHLVQRPYGRASAHFTKPLWVRTAQSPFGLGPYIRTQKHKALVGSNRTDVQARSFTQVPAQAHKYLVQSPGRPTPAHCIKPLWVRIAQSPSGLSPYRRTQKHRSTKPWWARTVQMYRLAYMSSSTHVPARARKHIVQSSGGRAPF